MWEIDKDYFNPNFILSLNCIKIFFTTFALMKTIYKIILAFTLIYIPCHTSAQTYVKLNAAYACVGIINPQAEFVISNHSSIALDAVLSPWKSLRGKQFLFGIMMGEYRYYFKQATSGFYLSANAGMSIFNMYHPQFFVNNKFISRQNQYGKGLGVMVGVGAGWEYHLSERWVMDVFIAFDKIWSWYNRYHNDGTIEMHPQGHEHYLKPDPFNGSVELMPVKGGISFGYKILKPHKK